MFHFFLCLNGNEGMRFCVQESNFKIWRFFTKSGSAGWREKEFTHVQEQPTDPYTTPCPPVTSSRRCRSSGAVTRERRTSSAGPTSELGGHRPASGGTIVELPCPNEAACCLRDLRDEQLNSCSTSTVWNSYTATMEASSEWMR